MKLISVSQHLVFAFGALLSMSAVSASAQGPAPRIVAPIENTSRTVLHGSRPPRALAANDTGIMPQSTRLEGMSINFTRSAAQQAALDALLAAQGDPTSPLFHKWLGPDQFAAQFGVADSDLKAVGNWLTAQGFEVQGVSRGLNRITFNGTEAQVEAAFGTQLHYFTVGNEKHFAPAGDLSIPSSLAGVVESVGNLSDFRPHAHMRPSPSPAFTSGQTGNHFLTPKDIATIYDINPAYAQGYTGAGQSIAVVGQSAVILSDIANFKSAAGVTSPAPIPVLYPGTGASNLYTNDESESDLDLEYTGAIAPGATVYFVYTGSSPNYGAFDSLVYAISNRIAPIITSSYGQCETTLGTTQYNYYNQYLQQAAAQGQTVIAAAGDAGSTDCYGETNAATATQIALAVDFPGSSTWVTSMGGTEISAANAAKTNTTYWNSNGTSDVIGSAISYIPEVVWNDDSTAQLSAGGGGVSSITARPTWQAGTIGGVAIPSGNFRMVPDISLLSSPVNTGYLYCSSDSGSTGVQGSCSNGFRDGSNTNLTAAAGTSFAAPIFAGMMAIINQATKSTGQGTINSTLYSLASSPAIYGSAFHDITSGTNACVASPASLPCTSSGATSYTATTGYDEASGLGSIDLYKLLTAWPVPTVAASANMSSTLTLTAATIVPHVGTSDVLTITAASGANGSSSAPTGTVNLAISFVNSTSTPPAFPVLTSSNTTGSATLSGGVASYSFSGSAAGLYTVVATYLGDGTYAPSTSTLILQAGSTGGFNLSAANTTVSSGSNATSTVTVTPVNGYTGTVAFTVTASPTIANACYTLNNVPITGGSAVTATLTIYTNQANCSATATALVKNGGTRQFLSAGPVARAEAPLSKPTHTFPFVMSFAGLLAIGVAGRRSRRMRSLMAVLLLTVAAFGISACTGASTPSPTSVTPNTDVATGPYTIVVQGTDTATNATVSFASFDLVVQ